MTAMESSHSINEKNDISVEIYSYLLDGYAPAGKLGTEETPEEYIITAVDLSTKEECGKFDVVGSAANTFSIRTCDPVKGLLNKVALPSLTSREIAPPLIDNYSNTTHFALRWRDIELTSRGLINFIYYNGAKRRERVAIKYDSIHKLFNPLNIEQSSKNCTIICEMVGKILKGEKCSCKENVTFMEFFNPKKTDEIIILGDFHGSLAALVRHLLRFKVLNIMDENCILNDNYHLVFLGDLIDRGIYSYEIMMIVYLLKILNPTNVHLNRGNHEEVTMNGDIASGTRLYKQMTNQWGVRIGEELHQKINFTMNYQPSCIIVKNPITSKYIFLAHGGLPYNEEHHNLLNEEFLNNIQGKKNTIAVINDGPEGKIITVGSNHTNDADPGYKLRWSDFFGESNTEYYKEPALPRWVRTKLGTKILEHANQHNIELVIRGHQDTTSTTKLIKKGSASGVFDDINTIGGLNGAEVHGSTHTIKLYKPDNENHHFLSVKNNFNNVKYQDNYLPVITLATCNDFGKNITRDGYAILKFHELQKELGVAMQHGGKDMYMAKYYKYVNKISTLH
jgi:Calcineurin-like phosphoesterase